jgi:hypothetical protein
MKLVVVKENSPSLYSITNGEGKHRAELKCPKMKHWWDGHTRLTGQYAYGDGFIEDEGLYGF